MRLSMMSWIIKTEVCVICRSRRLRLHRHEGLINIPNRTFLVHFGGMSGEFVPMARPNEPDMPPKRTKKVLLGIYRTQIQPKI